MRVSVIIPCHNAEPYLRETVASLLTQPHPPHEVIIVDDGSTDRSAGLADALAWRYAGQVAAFHGRFRSAPKARNHGAQHATGDALMFLDADDVVLPRGLDTLAQTLERDRAALAIGGWNRLEAGGGGYRLRPASCAPRRVGDDALTAWLRGWYAPPCAVLWSTDAFRRTGGWDPRAVVNNDGDLMLRALADRLRLAETDKHVAGYRRVPGSLSAGRNTPAGLHARLYVLRKLGFRLEQADRLDPYRAPLHDALHAVARDAQPIDASIHQDVLDAARHFGLSRRGRLRRRVQPPTTVAPPTPPAADTPYTPLALPAATPSAPRPHRPRLPRVSVVVPTYNRADTLPRTLRSVLTQTFGDFELLVVDDASTDDTAAVVEALDDPRVKLLPQPANAGVAEARNRGMAEARGAYLAFLDSDDTWHPHKLATQLALMDVEPRVGLCYTGVETRHADGRRTVERPTYRGDVGAALLLHNVIHGGGSNAMIRREVVAAVGGFDPSLPAAEDWDYWLRIARWFAVDHVPEPLVVYHDGGTAERRSRAVRANLDARALIFRKHAAALRRAGVAHRFRLETARRALRAGAGDEARRRLGDALRERPWSRAGLQMLPAVWSSARRRLPADDGGPALRIVMATPTVPIDTGGTQQAFRNLADGLRRRGHAVRCVWPIPARGTDDAVITPADAAPADPASRLKLHALLRRERPDIVNVHYVRADALRWLRARRRHGYKLVLSFHGSDALKPLPGDAPHLPGLLRAADAVTAVSGAVADALRRLPGCADVGIDVVPNGVDTAFFKPADAAPAASPTAPCRLVSVGRLTPVKGVDVLLHALAELRTHHVDARTTVVGDGESRRALEALRDKLNLTDRVAFVGDRDRFGVRDALHRADVFVMSSRSEGLPLAALEAMAAGLPVVATRVGGVPDVVDEAVGALVRADDAAALASALADLITDDDRRRACGDAARRRVAAYRWPRVHQRFEAVLRGGISLRAARRPRSDARPFFPPRPATG